MMPHLARNPVDAAVAALLQRPKPARFAVVSDPMRMDLAPNDLRPVPEDATFNDLIAGHGSCWMCQVAGEGGFESGAYLLPEWWGTCPRPGDVVVFHRRALGGGSSGRSLLQLAVVIVAALASSGASAAFVNAGYGAAGGFGASAVGAAAGIAVSLAGNALVNALIPLDASNNPNQPGQSPTYNVALQGNRARLGQPRPVGYGHNHTYPDFACEAYSDYVENEQFYSCVLEVTEGEAEILRVSISDTPVDHLADVEYLFIGPNQADGESLAGQTLVKTNVMASPEAATAEMEMLKVVGPFVVVQRGRRANKLRMDVMLPRGLDAGRSITWKVQSREINGYEQPDSVVTAGGWITLADETYSTASATPVRLSYTYDVDPARYEMRAYRTDIRDADANAAHDISLLGMACEIDEAGIDTSIEATYVVLRIRASQQLNGFGQFRVRVLWNRKIPIWDGSAWSAPAVTRSIAWAAADILRNAAYGRGLPDSQIDLTALLALDAVWAARFDKYDGVFDTTMDTWSALAQVLRVGRAVPLIRGSRYTFIRDAEDLEPVALYGMNNIRKGTFSLSLHVPERDQVTALDVEYWDYARWDWITLTVQYAGVGADPAFFAYEGDTPPDTDYEQAENRIRMRLPGAIGPAHVARVASFHLANMLFRRSIATYRTHLDGLLPAYCAPVRIAHDIPNWGQSGAVLDWDAGTGVVTTTEPLDFSAGGTHYMQLQGHEGGVVTWTVTEGAEPNQADVADDLGFTPIFDSANRTRTRYAFGPAANMGALCRVQAITPRGERDIEHQVVLEDARVHVADDPWMPVGGVDPDPPVSDGTSGPADSSDILVVRILDRTIEGNNQSGSGDSVADLTASYTLNDNGTAQSAFAGGYSSGSSSLANEWLQGGIVDPSIGALYEVRATITSTADAGGGMITTFTGAVGTWEDFSITWSLLLQNNATGYPSGGARSYRVLFIEIRDKATDTVQDIASVTLLCSYTEAP